MSCVRAPWTWGLFVCFCALFSLLNIEGVYNDSPLCFIIILFASNLSYDQYLFGEGLCGSPRSILVLYGHSTLAQYLVHYSTVVLSGST